MGKNSGDVSINGAVPDISNEKGMKNGVKPKDGPLIKISRIYINIIKSKWIVVVTWLFYFFVMVIPCYYDFIAKIPPENELRVTKGELFFTCSTGGAMGKTGLVTPDGRVLFTCKAAMGTDDKCLPISGINSNSKDIEGKQATIIWYSQPVYPGAHQNRLVELQVENKKIISRENTQWYINFRSTNSPIFAFIVFLILVGMYIHNRHYYNYYK